MCRYICRRSTETTAFFLFVLLRDSSHLAFCHRQRHTHTIYIYIHTCVCQCVALSRAEREAVMSEEDERSGAEYSYIHRYICVCSYVCTQTRRRAEEEARMELFKRCHTSEVRFISMRYSCDYGVIDKYTRTHARTRMNAYERHHMHHVAIARRTYTQGGRICSQSRLVRLELRFFVCMQLQGDAAVHLTIRDDVAAAQSARRSRKEADDMIAQVSITRALISPFLPSLSFFLLCATLVLSLSSMLHSGADLPILSCVSYCVWSHRTFPRVLQY